MQLIDSAYRTRYKLRNLLGSSRIAFFLMRIWPFWKNNRIAQSGTQLCIEGFPRSSNTFLYKVVKSWNPEIAIAHHLHIPMQAIYSAERSIPTVILVRRPEDAIAGAMNRQAWLTTSLCLKAYISFYSLILKKPKNILIFKFEDVIHNPSEVIAKINSRYNINLELVPWSKDQEDIVFTMTRNNPHHTAKDKPKKEELKQYIVNDPIYSIAEAIYSETAKKAVLI
ncbi:hypothetical protein Kalk_15550 [Ketobacter alkanivorans]|uniref:Sulfotransferase domain-containing protein n=1 Tax=Ketobacter alkanivorans TaxID=1917421 RepID=A0A2K9LNN6_9GAMM|nr:hypothetical protein Kalk_15550 [Ketobacter alkanivorans]